MGAPLNLINERFGRLVVVEEAPHRIMKNGDRRRAWRCKCDCGNEITATTLDLRKADVMSCGCLKKELDRNRSKTHGDHGTHLHNVWCAMRRRCNNHDDKYYGGKGVKVCDEWDRSYTSFKSWALASGYTDGLTIDRVDVTRGYSPDNCRWVSAKVQANNRSNNKLVTLNDETHTVSEWSEITGIKYNTLYMRLKNGWSPERALCK